MDKFIEYAPILIVVSIFLFKNRIFVTPEQLTEAKAEIMTYVAEHYVPITTYRDNHRNLQEQLSQIHQDINDVKNLLINKGGR